MTNPYHDENGRFCSKQEMKAIVDQLGKVVANAFSTPDPTDGATDMFDRWVSMKSDYEKAANADDPDRLPTKAELKEVRHRVAALRRGDTLFSPSGTRWTVVRGSRLSSVGDRKLQSEKGAVRWITPIEAVVDGWTHQPL